MPAVKLIAPKPLALTVPQLGAAHSFMEQLAVISLETGVYIDGLFTIELPGEDDQEPKLRAMYDNETVGSYVVTGMLAAEGGDT